MPQVWTAWLGILPDRRREPWGVGSHGTQGTPQGAVVGSFQDSQGPLPGVPDGSEGATAVGGVGPSAVLMVLLSYLLACLPIPEALTRHGPWSCALRCGEEVGRPRLPDLFQGRSVLGVGEVEVLGGWALCPRGAATEHGWAFCPTGGGSHGSPPSV